MPAYFFISMNICFGLVLLVGLPFVLANLLRGALEKDLYSIMMLVPLLISIAATVQNILTGMSPVG